MIIAFDVSHIRLHRAGLGRFSTLILRGLLSADHERHYLLHGWSADLDEATIRSFLQSNVRLSIAHVPRVFKRLYWNVLRTPKLETFIGPFDVFYSAEPLLPPLGKKRSIITFHDLAFKKFPQFFAERAVRKWNVLFQRAAEHADVIIVPSVSTHKDLMELMSVPQEKIHVVRPPVDPIFCQGLPAQCDTEVREKFSIPGEFILFVGTVEPRKNVARLVKAFEMFISTTKKAPSLVIVGQLGWLYQGVLKIINSSPACDKILLLNYVTDEDLHRLYRSASIFIFPSLYEGHGFPVVEAMASGLPVITSNNSSLREIGQGVALLIDPEDIMQMTEGLQTLYSDETLRREMSAKGLERAAQFSVKSSTDAILKIYTSLENR
ncbi:MAG: glycosyltransferase family 4 protein [Ignavibacteriae bacterium]|nr:glycosyltransferase family 4 protein [Ignavibacteriota bacterium]